MGFPLRIYLTGFMASGKSTVGPYLADLLGYDFLDMDAMIERDANRSIRQIFDDGGEPAFRALERVALSTISSRERIVAATGGGALANEDNMSFARSNGYVVYLDVSAETVLGRISQDPAGRPLLDESTSPEETVRSLMEARRLFYERADIRLDANASEPDVIAHEIMRRLRAEGGTSGDDRATDRARRERRSGPSSDSPRS